MKLVAIAGAVAVASADETNTLAILENFDKRLHVFRPYSGVKLRRTTKRCFSFSKVSVS
jgi:hypothetical protein